MVSDARKDSHHPDGPAADRVDVSADGTTPLELPPPPHTRRYIAAIIIGVSVAVAALVAALLLTRASPSSEAEGAVIGVGGAGGYDLNGA